MPGRSSQKWAALSSVLHGPNPRLIGGVKDSVT